MESNGNRSAMKGKGSEKQESYIPLRDLTSATDFPRIATRPVFSHWNVQDKNQNEGAHSNENISDLMSFIYQRDLLLCQKIDLLFCQKIENLQDMNKQLKKFKEKLEKGKKEANVVINELKEISSIEQRRCLEKKVKKVLLDPVIDEQFLSLLMETYQRSKLLLDHIEDVQK